MSQTSQVPSRHDISGSGLFVQSSKSLPPQHSLQLRDVFAQLLVLRLLAFLDHVRFDGPLPEYANREKDLRHRLN